MNLKFLNSNFKVASKFNLAKGTICNKSMDGVRIYDLWTLQSVCVGGHHFKASVAFGAVQAPCRVLCAARRVAICFDSWLVQCPHGVLCLCILISFERINNNTLSGDSHQLEDKFSIHIGCHPRSLLSKCYQLLLISDACASWFFKF